MKLALIIDDYLPRSTRVGAKMFHELALELKMQGHQVTVITPDNQITQKFEAEDIDGVAVWKFKSGPIKDVGKIKRAINETFLSYRAWKAINTLVGAQSFDGVIYYSPSIFWGGLVSKLKERCSCPCYLVLRDFFPQWVIDAGMLKEGSLIERYFRFFERYSYNQADKIGLMSDKNLKFFQAKHPGFNCEVLRNWAALSPMQNYNKPSISLRQKLNIQNKIIFFYGGNIGHAQDMTNLMRLANNMKLHDNAHFLFVGQGDEVELINSLAVKFELNNYTYLPSVSQDEFRHILSEIDIGLFTLSRKHTAHNFPGKLLGYMVESLPILGSVNAGNDLIDIINQYQAGFIHVNGEDEKLLKSAEELYFDSQLRSLFGNNSKKLLIEKFSVESAAKIIGMHLEKNDENH